jgi:tetratricopeptide (TPR) repeat protein
MRSRAPRPGADPADLETRVAALEADLRELREGGDPAVVGPIAIELAQALAGARRHDAAIALLASVAGWARDHDAPDVALALLAEEAGLEFDAGRLGHARARFDAVARVRRDGFDSRSSVRYGLALEADGRHREAVRHFGAALLDGDGPGAIEELSGFLLQLAEHRDGFVGAAYARAAREGFRIVADDARASRADELLRHRTRLAADGDLRLSGA